jgi:type II secretory pathway component GspD/PulD (secretin)
MRRFFFLTVWALCLGLSFGRPAIAQTLEIIELRNRPAEQIIPVVRPMLDRDGVLTGSGFQLMVRTSPANLAQIRQMVASIDRAARQLMIQVRQDSEASGSRFDARGGAVLTPGNSRATAIISDSSAQGRNDITQQVRTQEGSPALIRSGTSQLVPSRTVRRTVNGVVVQDTATERDIASGFYATPRVNGDTVHIEISTQRDTPANLGSGSANISRTATTISGKLGEWIEVGGVSQSRTSESSGIVTRSSDAASLNQRVYLRVDEVR